MERRSLLAPLGIAVLGLGLAAFLAFVIQQRVAKPKAPIPWSDPISIITYVIGSVGVAIVAVVLIQALKAERRRRGIAGLVGLGNPLFSKARANADDWSENRPLSELPGDHRVAVLQSEIDSWANQVDAYLTVHGLRHFISVFHSGAGTTSLDLSAGLGASRKAQIEMDIYLTRLGEIRREL